MERETIEIKTRQECYHWMAIADTRNQLLEEISCLCKHKKNLGWNCLECQIAILSKKEEELHV